MDKNSITGLLVIGAILFGFSYYGSQQAEEANRQKAVADSIYRVENPEKVEPVKVAQEAAEQMASPQDVAEAFSGSYLEAAATAEAELYTLENDKIKVTISSKGAAVVSVELKDYKTYEGDPLVLFKEKDAKFDLSFYTSQPVSTSLFTFDGGDKRSVTVSGEGSESLSFKLHHDSLSYVEYIYSLKGGDNMVDLDVNFVGMDKVMNPSQSSIALKWSNISPQNERGFEYENQYTTVAYMFPGESEMEELTMSTEAQSEDVDSNIKWVAFKQQFFSSILMAKDNFENGEVGFTTMSPKSGDIKHFSADLSLPYSATTNSYGLSFYFGPNQYTTLKSYDEGFESLIPLGWGIIGWINQYIVIPTFNFLSGFISSYGLIILLLTLIIKLIILPFTYKSYISMAKMRLLKPEIDAINAKFPDKNDAMKKQQEMMELYRKAGASPLGGCLPMLFQLPVLIAMFRFFPASIELRGQSFLWANDLSSYDSVLSLPFDIPFYGDHVSLFALLMGISLFVSSKLNFAQTNATANQSMPGMKFMTLYMMPIMLVLWFNSYASGLSYYYLLSNLVTIGQSYGFRRLVNDKKLHEQMKANAKKPRKQSGFQKRYNDMVKQQQKMQKNKK